MQTPTRGEPHRKMKAEIRVSKNTGLPPTGSWGWGLRQILLHNLEGADPENSLILDFQPSEPWDNMFLLS